MMTQITEYKIKQDHDGTRKLYYIIDTRNPHISQHSGFFSTRKLARLALQRRCWGENIVGDI